MMKLKTLIIGSVIATLLFLSFILAAPAPYPIYGVVTIDGTPAEAMQISIENTATGEKIISYTRSGEFVHDGTEFRKGYADSHLFKIIYCIDDSRCDETSKTFYPTGGSKDLSINLPASNKDLTAPFSIYGTVMIDGNLIKEKDVSIENINKGKSKDIETNEAGEYQWNIANWGKYDTGDKIRVCYNSYCSSDYVSNQGGLNINIHRKSPTQPSPTPPGNGGNDDGSTTPGYPDDDETPDEPKDEPEDIPDKDEPKEDDKPDTTEPETIPEGDSEDSKGWLVAVGIVIFIILLGLIIWYVSKYK